MNWRLRPAESQDATPIRELVLRAYGHYPQRIGARPAPMEADYGREIAEKEVWVAAEEERVRGVLVLRRAPDHLFVDNVAVAPELQGEGLGRALLAQAERRAAELRLREVRLLTNELMDENRAIYGHLGWEETETRREPGFSRVYFRKRVDDA